MINGCNSNYNNVHYGIRKNQTLNLLNSENGKTDIKNNNEKLSFTGAEPAKQVVEKGITLLDKVLCNKVSRWIFDTADKNRCLLEAFIATGLGMTLRPLTIMVTPGQKKEDMQYSVAKSFATAGVGLVFAIAVYSQVGNICKAFTNNKQLAKDMFKDENIIPNLQDLLEKGGQKIKGLLPFTGKKLSKEEVAQGFIEQNKELAVKTFLGDVKSLTDEQIKEKLKNTVTAEHISKELGNTKNPEFRQAVIDNTVKNRADQYAKLLNQSAKYIVAIPESFFLYKLVPPIINKLFPKKTPNYEMLPAQKLSNQAPTASLAEVYKHPANKQGGKI